MKQAVNPLTNALKRFVIRKSPAEVIGERELQTLVSAGEEFLAREEGSPDIYVVTGGSKEFVPTMEVFQALGFKLSSVKLVQKGLLSQIPTNDESNSKVRNYYIWQTYDWSRQGEEWSPSEEWKQSVIDEVMMKWIQPGTTVVEIGPGAGRWTSALQKIAGRLLLIDISDRCIELCKKRFADCSNIEYYVNDGSSLDFLPEESIDHIWSWDAFVHINPEDTQNYVSQFHRVLKTGGVGVIHHPAEGGDHGGWRSNMTRELFARIVAENHFELLDQFDSWAGGKFNVHTHHDAVSVFRK